MITPRASPRRDSSGMPAKGARCLTWDCPRKSRGRGGHGKRVARCGPGPRSPGSAPGRCAKASEEGQGADAGAGSARSRAGAGRVRAGARHPRRDPDHRGDRPHSPWRSPNPARRGSRRRIRHGSRHHDPLPHTTEHAQTSPKHPQNPQNQTKTRVTGSP